MQGASTGVCSCPVGTNGVHCERVTGLFLGGSSGSSVIFNTVVAVLHSDHTAISIRFRTLYPNGVLVATDGPSDFLYVAIQSSRLVTAFSLGAGTVRLLSYKGVSDGAWHTLVLNRTLNVASMYIDGILDSFVVGPSTRTGLNAITRVLIGQSSSRQPLAPFIGLLSSAFVNGFDIFGDAFMGSNIRITPVYVSRLYFY